MNNWNGLRHLSTAIACAGLIIACGGGSGENGNTPIGGIDRSGIAVFGTINNFGSVFVNGVEYETSATAISIDGAPGIEDDLKIGQVVALAGTLNTDGVSGSALSIDFNDNVEGPVQNIDMTSESMTVLGQTVVVDENTVFDEDLDPASLEGLNIDDIVEVSGFVDANGDIAATRIELQPAGGELELTGTAAALDEAVMQFRIKGQIVDYSNASLNGFSSSMPSNGDLVEAKGSSLGAGGELLASSVDFMPRGVSADEGDTLEIEGFITRFVSPQDFDVADVPVTTLPETTFDAGAEMDLALNVRVEVEGELGADGIVGADQIKFKPKAVLRVEAAVDSVDTSSSSLQILGITATVNNETTFQDKGPSRLKEFSLQDIGSGDFLSVRGFEEPPAGGSILATVVSRRNTASRIKLKGFVESMNQPGFVILGVNVETDVDTEFETETGPIDADDFFAQANGGLVTVNGTLSGDAIVANSVTMEDDIE